MTGTGSRRLATFFVLLLVLLLAAPAPRAQERPARETDYLARRSTLDAALVLELEPLAARCGDERAFAESDRLYGAILILDPEHRAARKALHYHKVGGHKVGGDRWVQARGFRPRRNWDEAKLAELRERITPILERYREATFTLIDEHRAALRTVGVERERQRLVAIMPDDPVTRAAIGEVLVDGEWLLEESRVTLHRRDAYPSLAGACLDRAPEPAQGEIRAEEHAIPLPWNAARRTERVRVVATTGDPEASRTARVTHAVNDLFRYVFAVDQRARVDYTIYLLQQGQASALLQHLTGLDQPTRDGLRQASGGWLGAGNRLGEWDPNPARRLDGAARQTLGTLLMDAFGIDGSSGWAWEGVGLYLIHGMLGTRMTWFFDPEGYQPTSTTGLWTKLQDPAFDWFAEAARLLDGEDPPRLVYLLGRDVNAMREVDVLYAYVVAAYLLEGHPQKAAAILRRIGAGDHPVAVFEEELGFTAPTIERRLRRWLRETRQ